MKMNLMSKDGAGAITAWAAIGIACLLAASPARGQTTLYTFNGDVVSRSGNSVSGAGDVNKDGFADLIVGAYYDTDNGLQSGSARVFSGVDGTILYIFNGDTFFDRFGISVSGAGDVNNDGYDDVIVGERTGTPTTALTPEGPM